MKLQDPNAPMTRAAVLGPGHSLDLGPWTLVIFRVAFSTCAARGASLLSAPLHRQGSSEVEQGTHKPLVGSSILPPGTSPILLWEKDITERH